MQSLGSDPLTDLILFGLGILMLVATIMVTTIPGHLKRLLNEVTRVGNRVDVLSKQLEMMDANLDAIRTQVIEAKKAASEVRDIQSYKLNLMTQGKGQPTQQQ